MSGYHALKGFEYQAVVSLDILLECFHHSSAALELRPEDEDDLVVRSIGGLPTTQHYYQIKKPREYDDTTLKNESWKLHEVIEQLLPNAITLLRGNQHHQTWVLGDEVTPEVQALVGPAGPASTAYMHSYVVAIHRVVRNQVDLTAKKWGGVAHDAQIKKALDKWQPTIPANVPLSAAVATAMQDFLQHATTLQISAAAQQAYVQGVQTLQADFADILSRVSLRPTYGTDQELRRRIEQTLQTRYGLQSEVVKHTLLGNLRSFMQDIATQPGRWISREEFELELRAVWPKMTRIAEPPALPTAYVFRPELVRALVQQAVTAGAVEMTGASGAGKTALARELLEHGRTAGRYALYAEVRPVHLLRDVLSGVAFHLRRWGIPGPFQCVANLYDADEAAIRAMGSALHQSGVLLIIDLVEGACSEDFARELAQFVEAISRGGVGLIVLGQAGGLRALNPLQRTVLGIPAAIDVPGLEFAQFGELVNLRHGVAWDRDRLYPVFEYFTGGRSAGLLARLADTLAQSASLADLHQLMQLPPDHVLAAADQDRYDTIAGPAVRAAADRLVCFALPFRLAEAEAVFSDVPVRAAVQALAQRGLLRQHDPERWEMHETIRAGLESRLAPDLRQQTHRRLAAHYAAQHDLPSQLLHLERGGQPAEAHRLAKAAFVAGEDYAVLAPLSSYLGTRRVVSEAEVVTWLIDEHTAPAKFFLLTRLIERVGTPATAVTLLREIRTQADRFDAAGEWSRYIVEAALRCDASRLYDLVEFSLEKPANDSYPRLELLKRGLIRLKPVVTPALLQLYAQAPDTLKARLTRLLLRDTRRAVLAPALLFASRYTPPANDSTQLFVHYDAPLHLRMTAEVEEFLAALPPVDARQLVVLGTMQFGRLEEWVWLERRTLQSSCTELLAAGTADEVVLLNALRVLLFLGDEQVGQLAIPLVKASSAVGQLATFVPMLAPGTTELAPHRACLFDLQADMEQRIVAFTVLLVVAEDVDGLYEQLVQADPAHARQWQGLLVMFIGIRPCLSAVPLLDTHLQQCTNEGQARLHATSLLKLADLPEPAVTELLIRCLQSPWYFVCQAAIVALQRRRSRLALPALLGFCQRTTDDSLLYSALQAAIASGSTDMAAFVPLWPRLPGALKWRCVLAGRLGAGSEAPFLQQIATARGSSWTERRAAILAAGHLPTPHAIAVLAPLVLAEPDAFPLDTHPHFLGHELLAYLLHNLVPGLRALFARNHQHFIEIVAQYYDKEAAVALQHTAAPTGTVAAQWLFDRLTIYDWARDARAVEQVLNELHLPLVQAAVFKGLRRTLQFNLLEQLIPTLSSRWLVAAAVIEWAKAGRTIPAADWQRLTALLTGLPPAPGLSPVEVLADCQERHTKQPAFPSFERPPLTALHLTYEDIMNALATGELAAGTLVIDGLTTEQIEELALYLDPQRDFPSRWLATEPHLGFTPQGFSVQAVQLQGEPQPVEVRARLRPALAAANATGVPIPWHVVLLQEAGLGSYQPRNYVRELLASLGAQQQADRLYEELSTHAGPMLFACDEVMYWQPVAPLLDERIVPILLRFAETGPDKLLEMLCWLASHVSGSGIDAVLQRLFRRWIRRFDPRDNVQPQHAENHSLWLSFISLKGHPRFAGIPAYDLRLEELLTLPLTAHHRREVVEALAHSPIAYLRQEILLLQATTFSHYLFDEVDRYDENASRLFSHLAAI